MKKVLLILGVGLIFTVASTASASALGVIAWNLSLVQRNTWL
jgi:hypothetical protein